MAAGQVYLVGVLEGCYKIGRAIDSERRLVSYAPKLPVTLTIHHRISTDDATWLEGVLHVAFAHRRALGEWFRLTPADVDLVRSIIARTKAAGVPPCLEELYDGHVRAGVVTPICDDDEVSTVATDIDTVEWADVIIREVGSNSDDVLETGETLSVRSPATAGDGDYVLIDNDGVYNVARILAGKGWTVLAYSNGPSYMLFKGIQDRYFVGVLNADLFEKPVGKKAGFVRRRCKVAA